MTRSLHSPQGDSARRDPMRFVFLPRCGGTQRPQRAGHRIAIHRPRHPPPPATPPSLPRAARSETPWISGASRNGEPRPRRPQTSRPQRGRQQPGSHPGSSDDLGAPAWPGRRAARRTDSPLTVLPNLGLQHDLACARNASTAQRTRDPARRQLLQLMPRNRLPIRRSGRRRPLAKCKHHRSDLTLPRQLDNESWNRGGNDGRRAHPCHDRDRRHRNEAARLQPRPSPKNGAEGAERVRSRGDRWRQLDGNVSDYLTPPPGRAAAVVLELVD